MAGRPAWRLCSDNGWFSAFGKAKAKKGKRPGPPVHDDLCAVTDENGRTRHEFVAQAPDRLSVMSVNQSLFVAQAPDRLWLTDITEHRTAEGKLYMCAILDAFSGRIVGYSID